MVYGFTFCNKGVITCICIAMYVPLCGYICIYVCDINGNEVRPNKFCVRIYYYIPGVMNIITFKIDLINYLCGDDERNDKKCN